MKLISAARLRRAQEALLAARPYHEALKRAADSVLRTAPEGFEPRKMMSVYCVTVPVVPLPVFHSAMAMVLVDPSVMSRSPIGGPVT